MPSDDTETSKAGLTESAAPSECVSLAITIDSTKETAKNVPDADQIGKCDTVGTTESENDLSGSVLKELVCISTTSSSTSVPSPSQILNSSDAIGTLSHSVNFDSTATGAILVDGIRQVEETEFAQSHNSTEGSLPTCSMSDSNAMPLNSDLPPWAARLKDCEMIGDSYRGYVNTEAELDLVLSIHKEHTNSCWGTRQSPSSAKPSVRLMWKSQYVPYDGIPFLNSGRRATVMECQYGPRRKGNKVKVEFSDNGQQVKRAHRPTCPARIYIKKVRKFPKYKIDQNCEGTAGTRQAQERALAALRSAGVENGGEERYYVQFPLDIAHEYHHDDDDVMTPEVPLMASEHVPTSTRLDFRVVEKINELVARGVTGIYEVKHGVINFVEKELFNSSSGNGFPPRHNKTFFPTITDLQNHIHQAKRALEAGTLSTLPPPEHPPKLPRRDERNRKRKRSEPRRVRTPKDGNFETMGTICVQTDQLEMHGDDSIQDSQASLQVTSTGEQMNQLEGQVFVMVPSSNSLFTTTDSIMGSSLNTDKATSLVQMQVVTVPTVGSTYLTQQGDGSLGLAGQYLSLPVVSYNDNHELPTTESETATGTPEPLATSITSSSISEQTIPQQTSSDQTSTEKAPTSITPTSPGAIAMVTPDIAACESTSVSTIANANEALIRSKEATILNTIVKNPAVDYLFVSEGQIAKSNSEFTTTNTDMNSIPCCTEESYNSSLDIIKTHDEITLAPAAVHQDQNNSNFSGTPGSNLSEQKAPVAPQEISSISQDISKPQTNSSSSELS